MLSLGIIYGFGYIHQNGYFNHLFVHKDYQGQGMLYQKSGLLLL